MSTCEASSHNVRSRQAIHTLIQLTRSHRRIIERRTQNTELHLSQHRMLMHISKFENIPSQTQLAEHFGISPAAVATSLKKLCADGYIERSKVGCDTRKNEIKITQKGIEEITLSKEYFDHVDNSMFEGFSNEEFDTLMSLLKKAEVNLASLDRENC